MMWRVWFYMQLYDFESLVWFHTKLHSTQFNFHLEYEFTNTLNTLLTGPSYQDKGKDGCTISGHFNKFINIPP